MRGWSFVNELFCNTQRFVPVLLLPLILFCFVQFCMILLNLLNHLLFILQNHRTFAQGRIIIIYCKWSISNAKRICFKLKSVYFCDVSRRAQELDQSPFMFNEIYFISVNGSLRMWSEFWFCIRGFSDDYLKTCYNAQSKRYIYLLWILTLVWFQCWIRLMFI